MKKNIMGTKNPNEIEIADSCAKRVLALQKYVSPTNPTITVNGETFTVADVIAIFQGCLDTRAALSTLRAQVRVAMSTRANAEGKRRAIEAFLRSWVDNQYGADSQVAHDFGYPRPKKPVLSVAAKAQANALRLATREARHTMGSKQKKEIKGAPSAPTAPADPAITTAPVAQASGSAPSTPVTTSANGVAASAANGIASH